MFGDFPPSSTETRFNVDAASRRMDLPTSVLPVNAILSTPGCRTNAIPAPDPAPGRTCSTPGGRPASSPIRPSSRAVSGVWLAGLRITQHPAASAGATFHDAKSNGKFQGTIAATNPTGSLSVKRKASDRAAGVLPETLVAAPA